MTAEVQDEANKVREQTVANVRDMSTCAVTTLKAILAHRGEDTTGLKATLVQRVHDLLK